MLNIKQKRKSDEQVEIVAYILKHRPVDTTNRQEIIKTLDWLDKEIEKRRVANHHYGAKYTNKDYVYMLDQRYILSRALKECKE